MFHAAQAFETDGDHLMHHFCGLKFGYTRLDAATEHGNITYFRATGSGEGPYDKDTTQVRQPARGAGAAAAL